MARSSDAVFPLSLVRDKAFQLRQIRRVLVLSLFFVVQSTLVLAVFYHAFLGNVVEGNAPMLFASEDLGSVSDAIPALSAVLGKWMVTMLVVNSVVTLFIAVYILRRLGSPILAMRRVLNEIGDGNLEVRLRVDDRAEFNELYTALNRALEKISQKICAARDIAAVADSETHEAGSSDESVRKALTDCHELLSYFDHQQKPVNDDFIDGKRAGGHQ
ncbi:MAG: HAMP domain-containing protein [Granulosicoccus sp.]